jgi:hypothetical protein
MYWRVPRRVAAFAVVISFMGVFAFNYVSIAVLATTPATAPTLVPQKGNLYVGVSDRGTATEFNAFAELTGKHPTLLESFHP